MSKHRMWFLGLTVCAASCCWYDATAETWRLENASEWEAVVGSPQDQYRHAMAQIEKLVREGNSRAVKEALKQLKEDYPDRVGPDLELFVTGELHYWRDEYAKALEQFEKLLKDYPGGDFAQPALEREFDMARAYLEGRKKSILGIIRFAAYADGIEIMERISDRAGLDEPNGVGLNAAVAVAEHYEGRERYIEAYLKWSEIASYWQAGPIGKRALYRMAENNLAAYNRYPPQKRANYDASKLTTARTHYERFLAQYPEEARRKGVPDRIRRIDEQMAYKQFTVGRYYRRTGKHRAANLYFDMVIQNWPRTEAAALAKRALEERLDGK